jgi:hypothetical protein
MGLWKRLFGGNEPGGSSEEGRVGAREIGDLISERAARFRGGRGMVLILQEGLRVRVFFFNGVPRCSWNYTNEQLSLDRVVQIIQEGPPVEFALREREIASLAPALRTKFSRCETSVQPLWHLDPNAWDYEVMRSMHEHDVGIRISFE